MFWFAFAASYLAAAVATFGLIRGHLAAEAPPDCAENRRLAFNLATYGQAGLVAAL